MKYIVIIFIIVPLAMSAQFTCGTIDSKKKDDIPYPGYYSPTASTPIKYIRINIHFMLHEPGHINYPGNYTAFDDGNGNTNYTGYDYAEDIINTANSRLAQNKKMNLPPGNNISVIEKKYRYLLNGVFFHESETYYQYADSFVPNSSFGINNGMCLNVYMQGIKDSAASACANMEGDRAVWCNGFWDKGKPLWVASGTLNHEIGHNLSLYHTIIGKSGNCNINDYCDDTPINSDLIANYSIDPCTDCAQWGTSTNCPNNQMGYNGNHAMTPEQLGRAHWTIDNELQHYRPTYSDGSSKIISSFTESESIIASSVVITSSTSITVDDNKALYISANSFTASGTLSIAAGSVLKIKPLVE